MIKKYLQILFFIAFGFLSCQNETLILVSKDSNQMVTTWLKNEDSTLIIKEFYSIPPDSMEYFIAFANGMVLCGGEDVNPIHYQKPEYDTICEGYDNFRDSIEFLMIDYAMANKVPIFGICRGQQILNVRNGGTLIPDIPKFLPFSEVTHRIQSSYAHSVYMEKGAWLKKHFGLDILQVNSRHHQSVGEVAPKFRVAAVAPDGIIESIEFTDSTEHPFAKAVQWHPEALNDDVSKKIARLFISNVHLVSQEKN